jgi:flagellar biosynthesis component FlhA
VRLAFKRLAETSYPSMAVLSYNEILPTVELISTGMVRIQHDN